LSYRAPNGETRVTVNGSLYPGTLTLGRRDWLPVDDEAAEAL